MLLCLDDSLFREVVRTSLLRLDRIEVVDAPDVAEAVDLVADGSVDVAVLDADGGSPDDVLADVERLVGAAADLRVIALLADEDHELIASLLDAGAMSCVSKSVYPSDLGAVIRQAARGTVFHRPDVVGAAAVNGNGRPIGLADPGLTRRELEILRMARDGVGNKQIARDLWITEQTVKFHLSNVYRKLGVSNRTRASRVAETLDLLSLVALLGIV